MSLPSGSKIQAKNHILFVDQAIVHVCLTPWIIHYMSTNCQPRTYPSKVNCVFEKKSQSSKCSKIIKRVSITRKAERVFYCCKNVLSKRPQTPYFARRRWQIVPTLLKHYLQLNEHFGGYAAMAAFQFFRSFSILLLNLLDSDILA